MPRAYDTDVQRHAETPAQLVFNQIVDCPVCFEPFDAVFTDQSMDAEDMAEPPTATLTCPGCKHTWVATYDGWANYGDA